MIKTSYQVPELRNANDEVVQEGAFGKNTALSNADNTGWIDYVMNDLEALHDTIGDSAATLDGNGHVVEPANLAIGDEDGNRIKTSYLKLTGGTVAGTVNIAQNLKMQDNQENVFGGMYVPASSATSQYLQVYGGEQPNGAGNARLTLYRNGIGQFNLTSYSVDGSTQYQLVGGSDGTLKWRGNTLAPLASPAFTGNPTAPTQATGNNSTRLATTAYVNNFVSANVTPYVQQTAIPNDADLNDYTSYGNYYAGSDAIAASLTNCPVTASFNMIVGRAGGGVIQWLSAGASVWVRKRTSSSWNMWHQMLDCTVGGTVKGTLTQEQPLPSSRQAYQITYTSVEQGVAPSSASLGYLVRATDSAGNTITGVSPQLYAGGGLGLRMYLNWGSGYARTYEFAEQLSGSPYFRCLADNVSTLGAASYRWKQLFAGTTTISTSDERLKSNIAPIDDDVLDAWGEVGWVQYQFKESVEEKGESRARLHTGAIAQRIESVFTAHGLDANRYGLLCYDEWDATPAERDEQGNITEPAKPAGNRYSLRYEEALCMEAAYQRRRADRLEERIARLEALMSGQE